MNIEELTFSIAKLALSPTDRLVIRIPGLSEALSGNPDIGTRLRTTFEQWFPELGGRIILMDSTTELTILADNFGDHTFPFQQVIYKGV